MGLKRTNVRADEQDLALIEEAAARKGDEPFVTDEETFGLGGPVTRDDVRAAVRAGYEARERRNEERSG
ncbi:hypothetical protein [Streptomyces bluensis]|uniref:hypothetical protein n=1 Tax=Streptomyces bluensis TaxID=33897 RepID=UPI00331B660F